MTIKIPFNKWSEEKIKQGKKFCTSRSKKYGLVGDSFFSKSTKHQILYIMRLPLWFVRDFLYKLEGADSKAEFIKVWKTIHKGQFDKDKMVYTHFFDNPHSDYLQREEDANFILENSGRSNDTK